MSLALLLVPPPSPPQDGSQLGTTQQTHTLLTLAKARHARYTSTFPPQGIPTPPVYLYTLPFPLALLGDISCTLPHYSKTSLSSPLHQQTLTTHSPSPQQVLLTLRAPAGGSSTLSHTLLPACTLPPSPRTPTAGTRSSIQRVPLCCAYLSSFQQKENVGKKMKKRRKKQALTGGCF